MPKFMSEDKVVIKVSFDFYDSDGYVDIAWMCFRERAWSKNHSYGREMWRSGEFTSLSDFSILVGHSANKSDKF